MVPVVCIGSFIFSLILSACVQLDVVGALGIFISLSDGLIGIYDLETCTLRSQLQTSKGANCFAVRVAPSTSGESL